MTPLLSIRDLKISIRTDEGPAKILDHVSFDIPHGSVVGVAGESGCGKSTLVKAILGILPPQAVVEMGEILYENTKLIDPNMRHSRNSAKQIGFIPQDPFTSFNPVFKIGAQLMEILRWSGFPGVPVSVGAGSKARKRAHLIDMFRAVRLPDPENVLERYPHQFSGGQRQRILIAAALAPRPKLLLADEPTTALDVTTQREILYLLKELVEEFNTSMLFVSHDFGVLAHLCDQITVMYSGQTMETGSTSAVIAAPQHPYTQRLLNCHPDRSTELIGIPGHVPSVFEPPSGCRFAPRCDFATAICAEARPPLYPAAQAAVACVLAAR
jgi:oligopeptide/dipeptide ABC transporter ATP-binding protein